jgi:predicted dehydrogenase
VERVRVGIVGGGPWAQQVHATALSTHPRARLAGFWTRRPAVADELATRFGTQAFADPEQLFDAVDVVAFAVPPRVQGELAVRAAAAGRHLICEKPLADTVPAARAVVDAVRAAGVHSSLVLTLRHDESIRAWLAGLSPAPAGPDTVGSARWLSGALLGGPYAGSRWRVEEGALLDLGPHALDLLDAALGPIRTVDWAHYAEPDLWQIGLTHTGGAHSTVTLSIRLPVDPSEIEFAVFGPTGRHRVGRAADPIACFTHLLDELVAAIDGTGPPPPLDAARGLRLQELIEQVHRVGGRVSPAE